MQGWMAKMDLGLARDDFYIFSVLFIGEGEGEGVREEKGEAAATSALVATTEKSVACKA